MTTADLFDGPVIAGLLRYAEELIDAAEEAALIERLAALDLAPFRFHGWLGNRRTQSFGWRYDFDDASFAPADVIPTRVTRRSSSWGMRRTWSRG